MVEHENFRPLRLHTARYRAHTTNAALCVHSAGRREPAPADHEPDRLGEELNNVDPHFWHNRWIRNEVGFHQGEVNPHLREYWICLDPLPEETVFVPLCGKAHDLAWLREQGHAVVGVELSPVACRDFFTERGIEPSVESDERFTRYFHDGIELWCGDYFELSAGNVPNIDLIYDRAALIALPEAMRQRYVAHLTALSREGTRTLLITLDYPPQDFQGPPFAVGDDEVRDHYAATHELTRLHHQRIPADDPLAQRGLIDATESVFRMRKRR